MKKTEKAVLIEGLRKLSADAAWIADALEGKTEQKAGEPEITEGTASEQAEEEKTYTFEDVRGLLADKARAGYKAEVKAILTAHGVKQLSDVKTPEEFAAIVAEAEVIGNA